jgi:hypothetical protein
MGRAAKSSGDSLACQSHPREVESQHLVESAQKDLTVRRPLRKDKDKPDARCFACSFA